VVDTNFEVPVQVAAYQLAVRKYIQPEDRVLDVGFGLGYGLRIMAEKAKELRGIDIDRKAVSHGQRLVRDISEICELRHYDGRTIPYDSGSFDVVTCTDVIEHVPDYMNLIEEMIRVSSRVVMLPTPNRRPEYTRPDGRPKNPWHLREWSYEEFESILQKIPDVQVDWNFLDGPWEGPIECSPVFSEDTTLALTPALFIKRQAG
jgi:ubiquinone/menaquinone biosynthesis C-methylase UbiE